MCPILSRVTTDSKTDSRVSPCNATALRKASRRVTQLYDAALEPTGLRSTQFAILVELANWSTDPPTLAELADALAIDRSSLGHNLRPLEREGLIVLREGAEDRRRRLTGGKASAKPQRQGRRDSNPRPTVLETAALPTELRPCAGRPVYPATFRPHWPAAQPI